MIPSTKKKQRELLDTIIDAMVTRTATHAEVLAGLRLLRKHLHNRKAIKRAPAVADPITPAKRRAVQVLNRAHPRMLNREIARRLNIDSGRVSEILAGKRH